MAYVRLADGSTFQGIDSDVSKAVAAYAAKGAAGVKATDTLFGGVTISPEVTKIVEKVPIEVEKVVEKMVPVNVLPERTLTKDEIELLKYLNDSAKKHDFVNSAFATGAAVLFLGSIFGLCAWLSKK